MKNILQIILRYGKTPLFFAMAVLSAIVGLYSEAAYIIVAATTFFIFFKKPLNFAIAAVFIAIAFISSHFYIATDVNIYDNLISVKTGSGRIHFDKGAEINTGDLIVGTFKIKHKKPFFKPVFECKKIYGVYQVPVISNLLKLRNELSQNMFYLSGGKVYMAQALIFGDKSFLSNKTKDEYTVSGLAHLLAMSGMHVGIIAAIFMTVLYFINTKFRMIAAVFGLLSLTVLGAFSITVMRAAIFASVYMACYFFDIKPVSKRFTVFMASLFIIFSPSSITDISFLLSFGAVFGIVFLMDKGYGIIKSALIMGVAATLITAPLSLYVFGTTNHLSILSTVIMSPVIYVHILFAIMAAIIPSVATAPLTAVEEFSDFLSHIIYEATYFGFINKTIPSWLLILTVAFVFVTILSKYKWVSVLSLLVIFYPSPSPPDIIFPYLQGSSKGFIIFGENRNEVFFQGSYYSFKYDFMPIAARYGIKTFDYGQIRLFGGENLYLKIKEQGTEFTNLCVNKKTHPCDIIYHTRSNAVRKKDLNDANLIITTKSKLKDNKIIALYDSGTTIINDNRIFFENESNR